MNKATMPGFVGEAALTRRTTRFAMTKTELGNSASEVVPQLPKWLKCGLAIAAETAACLGGPNPACIAAAFNAANVCL